MKHDYLVLLSGFMALVFTLCWGWVGLRMCVEPKGLRKNNLVAAFIMITAGAAIWWFAAIFH